MNDENNYNQTLNNNIQSNQPTQQFQNENVNQNVSQQPIQPQPIPQQLVQNNYNMNTQPTNTPKKKSKVLLIVIVLIIIAIITAVTLIFANGNGSGKNNSNIIVEDTNLQYLLSSVNVKFSGMQFNLPCKAQELINKGLFSNYNLSGKTVQKYSNSSMHDEIDGHYVNFGFTTFTDTIPIQEATVNEFIMDYNGTNAKFDGINIGSGTYKEVFKKYGKPDEQTTEEFVEAQLANLPPNSYYPIRYSVEANNNTEAVYSKIKMEFQINPDGRIYKLLINWVK